MPASMPPSNADGTACFWGQPTTRRQHREPRADSEPPGRLSGPTPAPTGLDLHPVAVHSVPHALHLLLAFPQHLPPLLLQFALQLSALLTHFLLAFAHLFPGLLYGRLGFPQGLLDFRSLLLHFLFRRLHGLFDLGLQVLGSLSGFLNRKLQL